MKKLISIIVPVYKVEDYLECCLDSLRRQSMPEIELILIDDASPDKCGDICDSYAARDERFRVIHLPKTTGPSAVRNLGIRLSSCDYLMFVDSDDWVDDSYCEDAYQCAIRNNADLVMFDFQYVKDEKIIPTTATSVQEGRITRDEAIDLLFTNVQNYVWNKLYRKELFNGVLYPEGHYYQDIATTYKTVYNAANIYYLNKSLYYYRLRSGSITTDYKKSRDWFKMRILQLKDLWNKGCSSEQFNTFLNTFGMGYCIRNYKQKSKPNYMFFAHILRQNNTIPKGLPWKRVFLFILFKYFPPVFEIVCTVFNRQ